MNRLSLYLKTNSISGEPPASFIRRIRFNRACKLLLKRRYSISETSGMVGFGSSSYFSINFKKYVGCLPSEYVKQHTKQLFCGYTFVHRRGHGGNRGGSCSCGCRNEREFSVYYKAEKHKNIYHLQPDACNALVDEQLERGRYCCEQVADEVSVTRYIIKEKALIPLCKVMG